MFELSSCFAKEETENELRTSISFCVTIFLLFALMSLILSSIVFMTSTIQLLQSNTL